MKKNSAETSLRGHPLGDLVEKLTGSKPNTVNDASHFLFRNLPLALATAQAEMAQELGMPPTKANVNVLALQINGAKVVRSHSLAGALGEIKNWDRYDEQKAYALLGQTFPRLFTLIPQSRKENNEPSLTALTTQIATSAGKGELEIDSPMCPPYHYKVHPQTRQLRHADGQLLPQIGPRFQPTVRALQKAMAPLAEAGVKIQHNFITYDGSDRNKVVELGDDVKAYYERHEDEMLGNLARAYADLIDQIRTVHQDTQIRGNALSIEKTFADNINQKTQDFERKFSSKGELSLDPDNTKMDTWVRENFGRGIGLLMYFVEQELSYYQKQQIHSAPTHIVLNALSEALLYYELRARTLGGKRVILDPETTGDYMNGPFINPTPVGVLKPFSPDEPDNPLAGARQPFNLPEGLDEYLRQKGNNR